MTDERLHRVLIVEDDAGIAELEKRVLSRSGIAVHIVTTVSEAIAQMERESFGAILLDYHLPDGDPWTVLDAAQSREPRVPVILVTAMGSERLAAEAIHRGVADYVRKSQSFCDELSSVVERVMRLADLEEANRQGQALLADAEQIAHLGSWEWDLKSNRITLSDELYRISGLQRHEFSATFDGFIDRIHDDDRDRFRGRVETALQEAQPFSIEYRFLRPDAEIRVLLAHGRVAVDRNGKPVRVTGTAQDVSEIKEAERRIRSSLEEKELLLKEIHHRVKNNLQIVSSLLALQAGHTSDPAVRRLLADSEGRIQTMALVHEHLYRAEDLSHVNVDAYFSALVQSVFHSMSETSRRIATTIAVDAIPLSLDTVIPCGLIVNELVTNSLKHAFPDRTGSVQVTLRQTHDQCLQLLVRDDGVGLPQDVDIRRSGSLGLNLVFALARQIGAEVKVAREQGTSFQFDFS